MRNTLKDQILDELYGNDQDYGGDHNSYGLTDSQLASRLDANEPSVRRARNELVKAGMVKEGPMVWGGYGYSKTWQLD